jgi:hypothetical protein
VAVHLPFRYEGRGASADFHLTGCMMLLSYTFKQGSRPMCDAGDRNQQALFVLETEWGCGRVDIGRIKGILLGENRSHECEEQVLVDQQKEHHHAASGSRGIH